MDGRSRKRKTAVDTQASYGGSDEEGEQPGRLSKRYRGRVTAREIQNLRTWGKENPKAAWKPVMLPPSVEQMEEAEQAAQAVRFDYGRLYQDHGYVAVIDAAYKEAQRSDHPFMKDTRSRKLFTLGSWREHGLPLLACAPAALIEAFYGSGVTRAIRLGNEELARLFDVDDDDPERHSDWVQRYGEAFAPVIYVRELVDENGQSPAPRELAQVLEVLRAYVSGLRTMDEDNAALDCVSRNGRTTADMITGGFHYFLRGVADRALTLLAFCYALEQRLLKISAEDSDKPLPVPLRYVGYAVCAKDRCGDYSADRSQSWLTEMVRDACRLLFGSKFGLQQHVVCFLTSHEECQIGEELLTRSGMAYSHTGTGFGVASAGVNVNSADTGDCTAKAAKDMWDKTKRFRNRDYFVANMAIESDRLSAYEGWIKLQCEQTVARKRNRSEFEAEDATQIA